MNHVVFAYNLERKCQCATWVGPRSPNAKEVRFEKSRIRTMLVAFFDSRGLIHKEFVPTGRTVNPNLYKDVLDRLIKRINQFVLICACLEIGFFSMTTHRPTVWHRFASFWPEKTLLSFITLPIHRIWLPAIIFYSQN